MKCRCTSDRATHRHPPGKCDREATKPHGMCRICHVQVEAEMDSQADAPVQQKP
jgi:hypothetical protein